MLLTTDVIDEFLLFSMVFRFETVSENHFKMLTVMKYMKTLCQRHVDTLIAIKITCRRHIKPTVRSCILLQCTILKRQVSTRANSGKHNRWLQKWSWKTGKRLLLILLLFSKTFICAQSHTKMWILGSYSEPPGDSSALRYTDVWKIVWDWVSVWAFRYG